MTAELDPASALSIPYLAEVDRLGRRVDFALADLQGRMDLETAGGILRTSAATTVAAHMPSELPRDGLSIERVIDELTDTLAWRRHNADPGMFAYVAGPGLPTDPLGHAIVASVNQNVTGYHSAPGASMIERTVIRWLCKLAGLGTNADGLLLGGGSWANLTALATALHSSSPTSLDIGIAQEPRRIILAAETVHFSIVRAAAMLGIGRSNVVMVPVDADFRMDSKALERTIAHHAADPAVQVCAVVATAGTTGTGSIDPLGEIGRICHEAGVWLHIDAAYGGAALLSDALRTRLIGTEFADSITIDLHKWAYLAFDASALLYREPQHARSVFAFDADYARFAASSRPEDHHFFDFAPEVSRRARAVPIYLAWRHYGIDRLGRNVAHNAECAEYLARLVMAADDFELLTWPDLSICCFRFAPSDIRQQTALIDRLNAHIVATLDGRGDFILSPMTINDRPILRVCICSYRTESAHLERLLVEARRIGTAWLTGSGCQEVASVCSEHKTD